MLTLSPSIHPIFHEAESNTQPERLKEWQAVTPHVAADTRGVLLRETPVIIKWK